MSGKCQSQPHNNNVPVVISYCYYLFFIIYYYFLRAKDLNAYVCFYPILFCCYIFLHFFIYIFIYLFIYLFHLAVVADNHPFRLDQRATARKEPWDLTTRHMGKETVSQATSPNIWKLGNCSSLVFLTLLLNP